MNNCLKCGKEIPDGAELCPECMNAPENPPLSPAAEPVPAPIPEPAPEAVPSEGKKALSKKKIIIIIAAAALCVIAAVLAVVFIFKDKSAAAPAEEAEELNLMPEDIQFGMTYDEIYESTDFLESYEIPEEDYFPANKKYLVFLTSFGLELAGSKFEDFTTKELKCVSNLFDAELEFNLDKELFGFHLTFRPDIDLDDDECEEEISKNYNNACDYYREVFGKPKSEDEDETVFKKDRITCTVSKFKYVRIDIISSEFAPEFHDVPEDVINDAFDSMYYTYAGFKINIRDLLDECAINTEGYFEALREGEWLSEYLDEVDEKGYSEYLSTSYLVTIHGDIMRNPDVPNLYNEDVDIIKVILVFNDKDKLIDSWIAETCSDFNTCAVLTMVP